MGRRLVPPSSLTRSRATSRTAQARPASFPFLPLGSWTSTPSRHGPVPDQPAQALAAGSLRAIPFSLLDDKWVPCLETLTGGPHRSAASSSPFCPNPDFPRIVVTCVRSTPFKSLAIFAVPFFGVSLNQGVLFALPYHCLDLADPQATAATVVLETRSRASVSEQWPSLTS